MTPQFIPSLFSLLVLGLSLMPVKLTAQVMAGRELVQLNPSNLVHEIAINANIATTITFPEKISLLVGFGLVADPAAATALNLSKVAVIHYENVLADTLVVRLIKPGEPCHATVRTSRSLYLMKFVPSDEANLAVIISPPVQENAAVEVSPNEVVASRLKYDAEELVGMLSKARNRKALQPLNPALFVGWQERNGLEMTVSHQGVLATIYEIQRNPAKDLTIFRCWLTNGSDKTYEFEPNGVKIRVGERSYDVQLVDCSGLVEPGQKIPLDLVMQGGPGGTREALSIQQDFRLELPAPGRRPQIESTLFGDAVADGK